ncbi:uncharacterized protein LOC143646439 [Tamandua tetradactyla]|uniref:uncharacterized protein LOC143646439 n=1 Tax=Tamandua tetradactyla TaxID=48850 RepID=UPI004053F944
MEEDFRESEPGPAWRPGTPRSSPRGRNTSTATPGTLRGHPPDRALPPRGQALPPLLSAPAGLRQEGADQDLVVLEGQEAWPHLSPLDHPSYSCGTGLLRMLLKALHRGPPRFLYPG